MLEAMRGSGRVAIARVVLRQKEHLVALRATDEVLVMETLVFADEVVPPSTLDEVREGQVEVSERELEVARQLIEMLAGPFDATQYHDDYRAAVLALIERKVTGEQIAVAPAAPAAQVAPDLMAALQASVEAVGRYNERWDGDGDEAKPKRRSRADSTAAKPTAPAAKPTAPAAKPTAPAAKPKASAAKPKAARQPTKKS
jgi:DNA end-binding protein Ku